MPVFASVFLRNTVLSAPRCKRALAFCLPCNYPLLNMDEAWTKKFSSIWYHSPHLSHFLQASLTISKKTSRMYSAKRCIAAIHWLTDTIGELSPSNWPFICVSKAYSYIHVLTSKANSACLLRKRESKQL